MWKNSTVAVLWNFIMTKKSINVSDVYFEKMNILLAILSNLRFFKMVLYFLVDKNGRCKKIKKQQLLTCKTMHLVPIIIRTV